MKTLSGHKPCGRPCSVVDAAARKGPVPIGTVQCAHESDGAEWRPAPSLLLCDLGYL